MRLKLKNGTEIEATVVVERYSAQDRRESKNGMTLEIRLEDSEEGLELVAEKFTSENCTEIICYLETEPETHKTYSGYTELIAMSDMVEGMYLNRIVKLGRPVKE